MNTATIVSAVRGLVRPLVTFAAVGAQIAFIGTGVVTGSFEAAKQMLPLTTMAVSFWFLERAVARASGRAP